MRRELKDVRLYANGVKILEESHEERIERSHARAGEGAPAPILNLMRRELKV